MPFGNWPVTSFRQRSVYKTEFDIFKQNTDIDLISLLSYEDHTPEHFDEQTLDVRPKTVPESKTRPYEYSASTGITERSVSRNRILRAYDRNGKTNKIKIPPEREFKRNVRNGSDTGIYRAFANTSKTFLKQKIKANESKRELKGTRACKSALDIRKSLAEQGSRSQSSSGFHPTDGNSIKANKTSTQGVTKVTTTNKEATQNRQVNKTERSILKHIWRTKSAPAIVRTNKSFHVNGHVTSYDTKSANTNKRRCSRWNENKSEDVHETNKTSVENKDFLGKGDKTGKKENSCRSSSPAITEFSYVNCNRNTGTETVTCYDDDAVQSVEGQLKEWENQECIENENVTCTAEKDEQNSDIFTGNDKEIGENSVTTIQEDGIGSKDSGFASNTATPELEFCNKEKLGEEKNKRVKFRIENPETEGSFEQGEQCSAISENGNLDTLNEAISETESKVSDAAYDVNNLIIELERFRANSRLSVISAGGQSNHTVDGDTESLCGDSAQRALNELREAEEKERAKSEEEETEENNLTDRESSIMSKEARHAIMETLKDMGPRKGKGRNKENITADIKYKGVNTQRRQSDNRSKYEFYMRERTKSVFRNKFKSVDSIGNDENSSTYSSPREIKECDDTLSEEYVKGKLFPSIRENTKLSKTTTSTKKSHVMTLEHVKKTKYKLPGIGNYHLIASPDNDFEITPPGFDSRYNPRPIISKEEMEIPPRFIRERSIEKCKSWLTNINLSPLSLQPTKKTK